MSMDTVKLKKFLIRVLPYILIGLVCTNLGEAWRMAEGADASEKLLSFFTTMGVAFGNPLPSLHPLDLIVGLICGAGFRAAVYIRGKNAKNFKHNLEYGSARWGGPKDIEPFMDPVFANNVILTKTERLMMSNRPKNPANARNKNVLIVGGSGSGKTRFWIKPNLLQLHSSYVLTDPKGTTLLEVGHAFVHANYRIKIFNTINFHKSMHFNPFAYLHSEKDILKLTTTLMANTKGDGKGGDPFWDKAETLLYCALIGYIHYEAPKEEQNFATLIEFINAMEVREDDEDFQNPVDLMFEDLKKKKPNHFAVWQYAKFKLAAGKTAKSILVSTAVRLAAFNLPEIARVTEKDEMFLNTIGNRKKAVFAVISDNDTSLNFIVSMLYSQAFQELYHEADRNGGRLPVHVRVMMDEFANVALPENFEKVLATCRGREISINIIIQNMAQIKAMFRDSWENLTGNCDTYIYLGGNESTSHEYISKSLGKETVDVKTRGVTHGRNGSSSNNFQSVGRELLTPDEVRMIDNNYEVVIIRGERAVMDKKFALQKHRNIKFTEDGGAEPYEKREVADFSDVDLHQDFDVDEIEVIEFD